MERDGMDVVALVVTQAVVDAGNDGVLNECAAMILDVDVDVDDDVDVNVDVNVHVDVAAAVVVEVEVEVVVTVFALCGLILGHVLAVS